MRLSWLLPLLALPLIPSRDPPIPRGYLGYTFCRDGLAETWLRADAVGTLQAAEVLAHEAVHRRQAADPGRADPAGHLGAAPPGLRPATVLRDGRLLQLRDLLLHHLPPHR